MSEPLQTVLEVAEDFDAFGGTSLELTAWETGCAPAELRGAWDAAIAHGLLEAAPADPVLEERMWRITGLGRLARARQPASSPRPLMQRRKPSSRS